MIEETQITDNWYPPVYIITGEQGEGKTTFVLDVLNGLKKTDIRVSGIIAPGYFEGSVRAGFSLIDAETGVVEELSSGVQSPDSEKHGRFYFRKKGLHFGYAALLKPLKENRTEILIIDEVGRFEMQGEIWSDCIDQIVQMPYPPMIWTVRRNLVDDVINRWNLKRRIIIEVGWMSPSILINELRRAVSIYRSASESPIT